jgi:hypothetical protein
MRSGAPRVDPRIGKRGTASVRRSAYRRKFLTSGLGSQRAACFALDLPMA